MWLCTVSNIFTLLFSFFEYNILMLLNPVTKVLLICFCGFLLSLSAPGYDLWLLAWIGLVPLFIVIYTSKDIKSCVFLSFLFGFSYNISYGNWFFSIHPLTWMGFSINQSLCLTMFLYTFSASLASLYFVLFSICTFYIKKLSTKYNKGIQNTFLISIIWIIIFNKLQSSKYILGTPWTLIEYSQYKNLFLIQISEYFGSTFISFLIVLVNLIISNFLIWLFNIQKIGNRLIPKEPGYLEELIGSSLIVIIIVSASFFYGVFLYKQNEPVFSSESKTICLLQGNLPAKHTRGPTLDLLAAKNTYSKLTNKNNASLFIAPEGSIPTVYNADRLTQTWVEELVKNKKTDIIGGTYFVNENYMLTNSAIVYSPILSMNHLSRYEKERLVPFGEYTPLSFLLPNFLKKLATSAIGKGFSEGKEKGLLEVSFCKVGLNICFESIYPAIVRKQAFKGANLLVNISDLSWYSSNFLKQQFLAFGVFRAIENRKHFIIASNSGISAFIDPTGKIKSQSIPNNQGVLIDWINPLYKTTFYSK